MADALRTLVAAELAEPVDPRVEAIAAAIAGQYGAAARAVLFYGSCLRERSLDDALTGMMLDFYLIVSSYGEAYGKGWFALANRLIPPNVFPFEHDGLTAKYAVLSERDFERECGLKARSTSVWARFAQPARLVWGKDRAAREQVVAAVAQAAPTLFALTIPTMEGESADDPLEVFRAGFALTYGAELRAERGGRPAALVDADPERYARIGRAVLTEGLPSDKARPAWRRRRLKGKALSVVRLAKASTTFAGGVDYLVWKINRHSGAGIEVKPWQRRWPILAAITLLPRLLKRGAIR